MMLVRAPSTFLLLLVCALHFSVKETCAQAAGAPAENAAESNQETPSRSERPLFEIIRSPELEISVDGRLDEEAWSEALAIPLRYEYEPGDGTPPPVDTVALLLFDSEQLYVAFRAEDPNPEEIRAHFMDRDEVDTLIQDDHVLFAIDTYDDQRRAFQFRINPFGVQADALFSQVDGNEDFSWDLTWESAGQIHDGGFTVEAAIPFHQLRFRRGSQIQTWGFDFQRSYPRSVRHRIAATYRDRDNDCVICQTPRIVGFEGMEPGLNLEVAPTVTANRTDRAQEPGGDLVSGDEDVEGGLSVRYSPTPDLTLNATINPDFSQVEADAAQLEVNEQFALFFPEQRPFFLEGADFFSNQIPLVFTRTVVDPAWGVKLTGKAGANAFGFFTAQDEVNRLVFPGTNSSRPGSIDEEVLTTVGRWRRDIGESSTLGVLYAGREGEGDYYNRVASVDAFFRFSGRSRLRVQGAFTDTRYPDELAERFGQPRGSFGGNAFEGIYIYGSSEWEGSVGYRNFSRGFRADTGFTPRADFETWRGILSRVYRTDGTEHWYTELRFGGLAVHTRDQDGRLNDQRFELNAGFEGPLQSSLTVAANLREQRAGDLLFDDLTQATLDFEIQPTGDVRFTFDLDIGDDVDFDNFREADTVSFNPTVELKLGRHLNAQFDYLQQDLDVDGGRLFRAKLAQSQIVYQFNVRTFLRGIFQYLDVDYDPSLYLSDPPPDIEQLFSQLLFSYTVNPQTVLFLGYSETRRGFDGADLTETNRTFFLKVGYAWIR
ncbi:MAG: DUF5916 domain-containing protein [Acidobacteriota bacterium]